MKEYSSKKYNLVLILLILVIASIFGVNFYFSSVKSGIINADPSKPSDDAPIEEPIIQPDDDNTAIDTPPVFRTGMEAAMYSIKQLDNLDFYCTQTNTTDAAGLGSVNIFMERYRHKNHDVLLSWSTNSTKLFSTGKFFQSNYSNAETTLSRQTTNYNFANKTYKFTNEDISGDKTKFEDFLYTDKHAHTNDFFIKFDSTNARAAYFKKDKNTYEVKLIFNQSMLNDSEYAQMFKKECDQVDMHKINLTLTIDRKTGYILKIVSEEEYALGALGLWAECKTYTTQIYNYNTDTKSKVLEYAKDHFGIYNNAETYL